MKKEEACEIIINAVEKTRSTWESYDEHWSCIDKVFLLRAYEQGGFEAWKFCKPMH